jgi:hypothetical protein
MSGTIIRIAVVGVWLFWGLRRCPKDVSSFDLAKVALGAATPAILCVFSLLAMVANCQHCGLPEYLNACSIFATYSLISGLFSIRANSYQRAILVGSLAFLGQVLVDIVLAFNMAYGPWHFLN